MGHCFRTCCQHFGQDEKLEARVTFWSKIWADLNPVVQTKASKTWADPASFSIRWQHVKEEL
jgi:hypothetical protein